MIHRGSPLVRVFHTWIFTGDGNHDRIRNMGWQFPLAGAGRDGAFLTAFDADAWTPGEALLQYDYEHFDLVADGALNEFPGGRAPGTARIDLDGARLTFGVKDFWQHYPSELEFRDGAFWFHNWPRHNRPARYTFDKRLIVNRGTPAASSSSARYALEAPDRLTRSEWVLNAIQARHAHEGPVLDFRLPDAYGQEPIWTEANQREFHWDPGDVETVNAQGVARTEEFWLLLTDPDTETASDTQALLQGLNDETLRAVVDPVWMADSGAFYEIHPRDPERFPAEEAVYEQVALSPPRIAEWLGIYGMWIHGDIPGWNPRLEIKEPVLYRAYRKRHLGWPYPWLPFARSGDPRFFKAAEAATRQLIDGGYCHYVSDDVRRALGPERGPLRRIGLWHRGLVPWVAHRAPFRRGYEQRADFLLDAWYLTGNGRARDQISAIMDMIRHDPAMPLNIGDNQFGRMTSTLLKSCVQLYEATDDPWFLVAAHGLSQGHLHGRSGETADRRYGGRLWDTGDREFLRFTGCPEFQDFYLNRHVARAVSERVWSNWNRRKPMYPPKAFAWKLTGDAYYLRRTAYAVDNTVYNAGDWNPFQRRMRTEPREAWQEGIWEGNSFGAGYTFFTPTHLRWFPHALWALAQADERPAPIYTTFNAVLPSLPADSNGHRLRLAVRKMPATALTVHLGFGSNRHLGPLPASPTSFAVDFSLTAPDGTTPVEDVWTEVRELSLPADAPAGVYQLALRDPADSCPVFGLPASDTGTPEVLLTGPNEPTPCVGWRSLWFYVPPEIRRFAVLDSGPSATVMDPDGTEIWHATANNDGDAFEIAVLSEQAGRLWRVTIPGHFRLSADIPPVYAVEPDRWFLP